MDKLDVKLADCTPLRAYCADFTSSTRNSVFIFFQQQEVRVNPVILPSACHSRNFTGLAGEFSKS